MLEFIEELFIQLTKLFEIILNFSIKYLQITFVYLIFFSSSAAVHIIDAFKKLCEKYPEIEEWMNKCATFSQGFVKNVHKLFANYRFEPEFSPWISITWLNDDNDIAEEYFDFSGEKMDDEGLMHVYYNSAMEESKEKSMTGADGIIIMKCGDKTRCNMIDKYDKNNVYEPSNVKFLAIEYKHPIMKENILIELDRSWFLCGNQLLSSVFIRRYLDYQPMPFYFDGTYTIVLIDNNMNITSINNTQYISLQKDSYRIIENEFDILSIDSVEKKDIKQEEEAYPDDESSYSENDEETIESDPEPKSKEDLDESPKEDLGE